MSSVLHAGYSVKLNEMYRKLSKINIFFIILKNIFSYNSNISTVSIFFPNLTYIIQTNSLHKYRLPLAVSVTNALAAIAIEIAFLLSYILLPYFVLMLRWFLFYRNDQGKAEYIYYIIYSLQTINDLAIITCCFYSFTLNPVYSRKQKESSVKELCLLFRNYIIFWWNITPLLIL